MHPYTWWVLGLCFAISAAVSSEVLTLLAINFLVIAITLVAREGNHWSRSLFLYLVTAIAVVVVRVVFRIVFNFDSGANIAISIPALRLSLGQLGSVELFGRVSWDALFASLRDGMRMAAIILSVGLANSLANPRRLLKNTPGALYEVASAWVIAINMAPQLIESSKRVRKARLLRGRSKKHNLLASLIIPVLEDTIERSLSLAASMSVRGFGRQGLLNSGQQLQLRFMSMISVLCLSIGAYLLLTLPTPWIAVVLLGAGVVFAFIASRLASLRQIRTRYQPDRWSLRDSMVCLTGATIVAVALIGVF